MRTITKNVYTFSELSDKAKERITENIEANNYEFYDNGEMI